MSYVWRCLNIAIPFVKPKYIFMIDSELVVRMDDEKVIKIMIFEIDIEISNLQAIKIFYIILNYIKNNNVPFA